MEENSIDGTPEAIYRKKVFSVDVSELDDMLNELCQEFIPESGKTFIDILKDGMQLLSVNESDGMDYDVIQKNYYKALHKVVVLHHRYVDEDLANNDNEANVKNLIKFNKLFEIFYYTEQAIRSLWNVKKASHPLYDSLLNTDVGLFRFRPIDPDMNSRYQNLILYLLSCLAERGWRRQLDQCMERIYTDDGYDTHAWKPVMSIREFVYDRTQKDINFQQWFNLTSSANNATTAIKYLTEMKDSHFIDIEKDRKLFSFNNGIYETSVWNEEKEIYEDKWYPHKIKEKPDECTSMDICPKRSSCKFFEEDFVYYDNDSDWYDIPTPHFQSMLDYQEFPEEVCRWMYILVCGRLLHEVGELDGWQVMPFLKGVAKSGKSTTLEKVCKEFFHPLDVGVLSNNCEKKFGLSALKDKLLFIAPEIKENIGLEQCDFQTIISGEDTSVAEKFKTASSVKWTVPGAMAGNEPPGYSDNQGSISRRLVVFNFKNKVKNGDTRLGEKLKREVPMIIMKGNKAYLEAVSKYGKKDLWSKGVLPKYFIDTQDDMASQTNPLVHFLNSDKVVFGEKLYCRQTTFVQLYNEHVKENSLKKFPWKKDFYESPLSEKGVKMCRDSRLDKYTNRKINCIWVVGVDIVNNSNNDDDDDLE